MLKDRANAKFQPKGQGLCGQFVCHWTESKVREILGEGPSSIGHPNIARINLRLSKMVSLIVANKGYLAIHVAKRDTLQKALEMALENEKQARLKLAESREFQEATKIQSGMKLLLPWATQAGCAKCRWKVEGSTCCNPDKMMAKERAHIVWI